MADRKEVVLEKLDRVRQNLLAFIPEISEEDWERKVFSEEGEWRVSDLLRHVVAAEPGMTGSIENIRDGGKGAPPDFDLSRWNASRVKKTREKSISDLTTDLVKNRTALLEVVDTLKDEDWDKEGLHASLQMMTIEGFLHRIADHEEQHMRDMKLAVGLI